MKIFLVICFLGSYNLYAQDSKPEAQVKLEEKRLEQFREKEKLRAKYNKIMYMKKMKEKKK